MNNGLAGRQAALIAALTSGAAVPPGFDPHRVQAARAALLRKRAGEVARHWPMLAATLGPRWLPVFTSWADQRPTGGALVDGWLLARELARHGGLPPPAAEELAIRDATWHGPTGGPPRPRRWPALRAVNGVVVVQVAGRIRVLRRPAG